MNFIPGKANKRKIPKNQQNQQNHQKVEYKNSYKPLKES
jgi:hypothetical protein